jgi:formylglycine-generating enzyme required for sulfatase activity
LNWAYNILAELEPNAILFTVGDNDTYATWIVQASKQFRKDVTVVNTSLMTIDDYRNILFKDLSYPELAIKAFEGGKGYDENVAEIYKHFFNGKRPVYVAATGIENFKEKYGDKLYLTGLAYKYGNEPIDNISIIKRNFEKRYLLDHLTEVFAYNISDKVVCGFNETYLPALLKLHKHYQDSEEFGKAKSLEKYIVSISEESGQQGEVLELLENKEASNSILINTLLDVKTIEKNMLPINEKVFVAKYETSNEEYKKFLINLQRSKKNGLYSAAMYDSTGWKKKFQYAFNDPMVENYHFHPAYQNYPIVNISFEGAKAYCEWLTQQYNAQRKRKYTQVVFRLPTEQEWKQAAGSGNITAKTPFQNDNIQNAEKCYLANIKVAEGKFLDDGAFHTASKTSYLANKSGFFNTFGNVAEMIDKKGIAKGGSWYNTFEESTFDKQQTYTTADPGIGFRIVMEVIVK